eukprot:3562603-Rhodomonas_salina.2
MGQHRRLGKQSPLRLVDSSLLELICSQLPVTVDCVASIQRGDLSVEEGEEEGDNSIVYAPEGSGHSIMVFKDGRDTAGVERQHVDLDDP